MKFPYQDLYYLKARGPDDKRPAEKWGGYNQDFADGDEIYTHDEVKMLPHEHWLTNAVRDDEHMTNRLLIFDIDVHKAPEGFDGNRVGVPTDTPIIKSQSGGYHVYFVVNSPARAKEADFEITAELPFDIDIRGEFVRHHVVAPNCIPGVGGAYELVNDDTIKHVFDPDEAARRITLDGEPALQYNPGCGRGGGGYERDEIDPPDDLPKCYAAGLSLRAEAPEDPDLNTHKVNVLAALAGLGAGYDTETVVDHFVDDYYPGEPANADRDRTEYQVNHIARKLDRGEYDPPSIATMQEYGILPPDEWCYCGLPGHDKTRQSMSDYYDADLPTIARIKGIEADPHEDKEALLEACLYARAAHPGLAGEKPPYGALVAVAGRTGLPMDDPDKGIIGETSYKVARRVFDDMEPGEVSEEKPSEEAPLKP